MKFTNILGSGERANIENIQSDFVSLASHQLRTPLSAVKWFSEILIGQKQGKLNPKQLYYLREIYRSNERAISLINDLLDVSRIQEGHIHLELRDTYVEKVIEEILDSYSTLLKSNKVSINFEIINGPLPKIEADQEKLKRIIINLLSNSIKYTEAQGKIRITVEKDTTHLTVSVTDSGIGIPKKDQANIFKKFFRSTNVIKMSPDGSGLGLFITKSLVDAMGGKISFRSKEGEGTTFYFTLPIK
ncbi:sensor histidine kinase [bacterium]|nr:MAG: sensor histidine kinase [bacterium]